MKENILNNLIKYTQINVRPCDETKILKTIENDVLHYQPKAQILEKQKNIGLFVKIDNNSQNDFNKEIILFDAHVDQVAHTNIIPELLHENTIIKATALDDRIGVVILLELIKNCVINSHKTYLFAFTTHEEDGYAGAKNLCAKFKFKYKINISRCYVVDACFGKFDETEDVLLKNIKENFIGREKFIDTQKPYPIIGKGSCPTSQKSNLYSDLLLTNACRYITICKVFIEYLVPVLCMHDKTSYASLNDTYECYEKIISII